jgi:hypothetical protein
MSSIMQVNGARQVAGARMACRRGAAGGVSGLYDPAMSVSYLMSRQWSMTDRFTITDATGRHGSMSRAGSG